MNKKRLVLVLGLAAFAASPVLAVTAGAAPSAAPSAAPETVAFEQGNNVYTVAPDGTGTKLIVSGAESPGVSPDGTRLAYLRSGQLWVARIDGSAPVEVTSSGVSAPVSWAPDSTRLAYTRGSGSAETTWVANADASGQRQLVAGYVGRDWSPDGARLIVTNSSHNGVVDVATAALQSWAPKTDEGAPAWSPDGTFLASEIVEGPSDYCLAPGPTYTQVIRRPDGTLQQTRPGTPGGPWSTDGTRMLVRACTGLLSIVSRNVMTGAQSAPLASIREYYDWCSQAWSADSTHAYVCSEAEQPDGSVSTDLERVPADGGGPDNTVAQNPLSWSVGGGTRPTDPNGAPGPVTGLAATATPSFVHVSWTAPASTPDFAGVEVRYALGDTPPATPSAGLDGGRLLTSSRDLGPFPPGQPIAISVFSHDWTGHTGPAATTTATTPQQAATAVTAHAAPFDLVYPGRSTISGTITRTYDGAPVANTTLTVAMRHWNTTDPFVDRATIAVDASGHFAFDQVPGISYDYELRYAGDDGHAAATGTTRIRVAHRVTQTIDHTRAPAGTPVHLTATIGPAYPNGKTYLQTYTTRAINVGPHNTDAHSKVVYTIKAPAKGKKAMYRVFAPGTGSYINGQGAWITITGT